jgi:hypothetical protein
MQIDGTAAGLGPGVSFSTRQERSCHTSAPAARISAKGEHVHQLVFELLRSGLIIFVPALTGATGAKFILLEATF